MVKTITMTALLFLAGVGAVLWLMPYEWLWIVRRYPAPLRRLGGPLLV
jgi:hypothetical protein